MWLLLKELKNNVFTVCQLYTVFNQNKKWSSGQPSLLLIVPKCDQ